MVSYDEYKKIVAGIMNNIYEIEKQRHAEANKLRLELIGLVKDVKLSDPERFMEILEKLSALDSISDKYNFNEADYSNFCDIDIDIGIED